MTAATAGAWIWSAEHQLYYHPDSNTYASADPTTGQWTYLPADSFGHAHVHAESSAQAQQRSIEKEEGEVDDDVGWGGLMEPEEVDRVIKSRSGGLVNNGAPSYAPPIGAEQEKHPAYRYDDPARYAYPSRDPTPPPHGDESAPMPDALLRLVVLRSTSLPEGGVAVIDAREGGVQIGRDRCERGGTARVRVKEMEASKTHAVVYYGKGGAGGGTKEEEEDGWWVVDLGSTHGTYITPPANEAEAEPKRPRLSEPKQSSLPHLLTHLCTLRIGSTTFVAHIHASWPCHSCQLTRDNEIRLDDGTIPATTDKDAVQSDEPEVGSVMYAMTSQQKRDNRETRRKLEMASLKERLLNKPSAPGKGGDASTADEPRQYVDRSAMRRRLHPNEPAPASARDRRVVTSSRRSASPPSRQTPEPVPAPVSAFASSMLAKQGWEAGKGLGKAGDGRAAPVQVELRTEKRGLGAKGEKAVVDAGPGDWRARGKQRRFEELKTGSGT